MSNKQVVGPLYDVAYSVLHSRDEYRRFRAGEMSRAEYAAFLDRTAPALVDAGLPAEDVEFAKRYPRSEVDFVKDVLADLAARGILEAAPYDAAFYEGILAARGAFDHGPFKTYIYPEEARLLFAIADVFKPRSAIFLGSYYGYWAHAATAAIVRAGGRVVLVDPDERAQDVARRNLAATPYAESVEVAVTTGELYLSKATDAFDFVVLDAEGPRTHPDPEQRGKRVYAPLLRHCLPHTSRGALLVCHNILFEDHSGSAFFDRVIERNRDELGAFMELVGSEFPNFREYTSTEGVGVGSRRR
jgi:predicted O-methyltransferase YrrM